MAVKGYIDGLVADAERRAAAIRAEAEATWAEGEAEASRRATAIKAEAEAEAKERAAAIESEAREQAAAIRAEAESEAERILSGTLESVQSTLNRAQTRSSPPEADAAAPPEEPARAESEADEATAPEASDGGPAPEPEATAVEEPRAQEPEGSPAAEAAPDAGVQVTPDAQPAADATPRRGLFGRRGRGKGDKGLFISEEGQCAVCGTAFAAGSRENLELSGWRVVGEVGLCPDCQQAGWQLADGQTRPYRRTG